MQNNAAKCMQNSAQSVEIERPHGHCFQEYSYRYSFCHTQCWALHFSAFNSLACSALVQTEQHSQQNWHRSDAWGLCVSVSQINTELYRKSNSVWAHFFFLQRSLEANTTKWVFFCDKSVSRWMIYSRGLLRQSVHCADQNIILVCFPSWAVTICDKVDIFIQGIFTRQQWSEERPLWVPKGHLSCLNEGTLNTGQHGPAYVQNETWKQSRTGPGVPGGERLTRREADSAQHQRHGEAGRNARCHGFQWWVKERSLHSWKEERVWFWWYFKPT